MQWMKYYSALKKNKLVIQPLCESKHNEWNKSASNVPYCDAIYDILENAKL